MMATPDDPRLNLVESFFSGTGSSYDDMVHYATLGIDARWKLHIMRHIPADATRILDLASGTGILTLAIANRFPAAEVVGVELRNEYLTLAQKKQQAAGQGKVSFHLGRAEQFRTDRPFDCVVSSYLAKYADLPDLAASAAAWLKPDGIFVAHDFTFPPDRRLARIWRLYFWCLQRLGSPWWPAWREIFYGLPRLIEHTRWTEELPRELGRHGFHDIRLEYLTLYGSALLIARRSSLLEVPSMPASRQPGKP